MNEMTIIMTAITHWLHATLRRVETAATGGWADSADADRHRRLSGEGGAVSLEQVLWFVAAGVSVAVVSAIMWGQIRSRANATISVPVAP